LGVVVAYLIAITAFGLQFSRRNKVEGKSLKSYFLADNTIPWWAIGLSIVSAETSTLTIISIPGVAFAGDFGFLQLVLGYMVGRVVVALLFLPRYFKGEMLTAYQLIDRRFGHALHKVTAGLFLLTRAAAEGVRVFAISIVVGIAIDVGDVKAIAIICGLTLLYTFEGGMAAVIWTDVVQMALYVGGTMVALWTLGAHIPGGWGHIVAVAAPLGKFHWLDFTLNLTTTYTFWAGVLGGTFLTMASHGTDQLMVQRMLAARNLRGAQAALLGSGVVIFVQFCLFLLIGVGLFVFYGAHPGTFASNDRIFPTFIVREMPHGVAGLLIAAILAAAMSNLSAALNSLASTTVIDFYVPFRAWRGRGEGKTTLVSRGATVAWAVVLFAIAVYSIQVGGKGHVVEIALSIASVAYGCLLGVFLLGTLTRYATQTGAILGMVCGFGLNLWLWRGTFPVLVGPVTIPHVAYTWYVLIGAIVTFAIGSLCSLLFRRKRAVAAATMLLVCGASFGQRALQPEPMPHDFDKVSAAINTAIAEKKLPGAVLLVGHGGKVVFEQAYGNRALEPEVEPMTEDTIFDMASLSKVIATTTAVLQLYEQKKIDLDAPVAKYLPEFAANGKDKITVRELMTHYSGLAPDVDLKDSWGLDYPSQAEGIRRAWESVPEGSPSLTFKYSDINFITLGSLVQWVSGQPLDEYVQQHVFAPLGLTETRYLPTERCVAPPESKTVMKPVAICKALTYPNLLPRIAPTAHDDEGNATTNPDFDHILRGVVHDPTTRRMGGVAGHAGVFSTAHDMSLFCQALLDKLLYNEGPFPLSQATLQMATRPNEPATAVATATIFTPGGETTKGVASRGLGWDLNSAFSRPRGSVFPITTRNQVGSFGHTGFTGTSIWFDPTSDTYVVLLANAIHPKVGANISPLRSQVDTLVAKALGYYSPNCRPCPPWTNCDCVQVDREYEDVHTTQSSGLSALITPASAVGSSGTAEAVPLNSGVSATTKIVPGPEAPTNVAQQTRMKAELKAHYREFVFGEGATQTGIDVLESTKFAALKEIAAKHGGHLRIGLVANQSSRDSGGKRTIDVLENAGQEIELTTLFAPEHGLLAKQDTDALRKEQDVATGIPVVTVYGPKAADKHPKQEDLAKLDVVVIDLQDAGVRFWTYETLTGYFLEACAAAKVPVVILDRPNPVGGLAFGGPMSDAGAESYVDYTVEPVRHGMTLGELARWMNQQRGLGADVTVVPMRNWSRGDYWAQTGLKWTPPSPNLKTPEGAVLYPGVGLTEQTNISVGRGTDTPFENLGAAWIDATKLAEYLTARKIAGVRFTATTMTIAEDGNKYPFHGETIPAVHFTVTDAAAFDSPEMGVELLGALHTLYPAEFKLDLVKTLLVSASTLAALKVGADPREIAAGWAPALATFAAGRKAALIYPE
jgi:SSS family transporter